MGLKTLSGPVMVKTRIHSNDAHTPKSVKFFGISH